MTTPYERTRTVIATGDFLKQIEQDESLRQELRTMANQLLRHYPTRGEVLLQACFEAQSHSPFFEDNGTA